MGAECRDRLAGLINIESHAASGIDRCEDVRFLVYILFDQKVGTKILMVDPAAQ